jgi:hypothetical protein
MCSVNLSKRDISISKLGVMLKTLSVPGSGGSWYTGIISPSAGEEKVGDVVSDPFSSASPVSLELHELGGEDH